MSMRCAAAALSAAALVLGADGFAQCLVLGCDGAGSNRVGTQQPLPTRASVSFVTKLPGAGGVRCLATSGGEVVCGITTAPNVTSGGGLYAVNTTGDAVWHYYPDTAVHYSAVAYPAFDPTGSLVYSAAQYNFIAVSADGAPLGPPLNETFPTAFYSLVVTQNGVVIFPVKDTGVTTGYLENGVPHASVQLRATVGGVDGVFATVGAPAIDDSVFYLMTEFSASPDGPAPAPVGLCRIYAIGVHRTLGGRMVPQWNFPFPGTCGNGASSQLTLMSNGVTEDSVVLAATPREVVACVDNDTACLPLFQRAIPGAPPAAATPPAITLVNNTAVLTWPATAALVLLTIDGSDPANPTFQSVPLNDVIPGLTFTRGYRVASARLASGAAGHLLFAHVTDTHGAAHLVCLQISQRTGFVVRLAWQVALPQSVAAAAAGEDRQMVLVEDAGRRVLVVPGSDVLVGVEVA